MCRVLIDIDATHAGIRTSVRSTLPSDRTSSLNGTLPYPLPAKGEESHGFGGRLSPVTLSAQSHSTSELLRTLSRMAASKPTSWLSLQRNILSH